MQITRLPFLVFELTILLLCSIPSYGQIEDQKVFNLIPPSQRASFISRLALYIEYSVKDQQDKLETLYDEDTLCSMCKGKRECIDNCRPPMTAQVPEGYSSVLVALRPRKVEPYTAAPYWNYSIDAEQKERVSWKGKPPHVVKSKVRLFAVHKNGDWFFSLLSVGSLIKL
jgi:hypothetical protein